MTINVDMRIRLNLPYAQAVQKTTDALKAEGFGVLAQTNMQTALKHSPNIDFRRHVILGACNPPLAHHALSMDLDIELPLPCNVNVYEEDDGSVVTAVDPLEIFCVLKEDPMVHDVALQARVRLQRVIAHLKQSE
ncbi:MAG: DUF302 domain-containing protein [Anaerolineales bacterium]|nr:DUF302 domain-containing protein [Anaerolineales bacterium]